MRDHHGKGLTIDDILYECKKLEKFVNKNLLHIHNSRNSKVVLTTAAVAVAAERKVAATEGGKQTNHPQLEEPLPAKNVQVARGRARKSHKKRPWRRGTMKDELAQLQQLIPNSDKTKTDKASILEDANQYIKTLSNMAHALHAMHGGQARKNISEIKDYNEVPDSILSVLPISELNLDPDLDLDMDMDIDTDFGQIDDVLAYINPPQPYPMILSSRQDPSSMDNNK